MGNDYNYFDYLQNLGQIPTPVGMLDFMDSRYKDMQVNFQVRYMFNRTQKIFEYEGLPDSIPARMLETILQTCGNVCLTEVDGKPRAFFGGLGGMLDEYYQPTIYTIANPYLKFDANLKIGDECIWGRNDSFGVGLLPLFQWYASLIVETGLSIRVGVINSRIAKTISADDDGTYKSALKYLEDIESGKLGAISQSAFFEGLNIHSTPTANEHLTDIIETMQYLKASWFNDLGLNANYNMKRERIQNAEVENDNDALLPLIDDMLSQREEMLKAFNEKYGYDVKVKLASAWEDIQEDSNDSVEDSTNEDTSAENGADEVSDSIEPLENEKDIEEMEEEPEPAEEEPESAEEINVNVVVNVGDDSETNIEETEEATNDETPENDDSTDE